jgi:hypothetical protein
MIGKQGFIWDELGWSFFGCEQVAAFLTGGVPRQSASEPPVFCFGKLETPSPASAVAMFQSHERDDPQS